MNTIILRLILGVLLLANPCLAMASNGQAANMQAVSSIPVRFLHNITSRDINSGEAIPLEIIHDINIQGRKVFAQGGAGYAYVDEVKKARWLGRGGKITISHGVIVDVMGNTHNVFLSQSSKGSFKLGSAAGALALGSVGSDIIEAGSRAGSISGTLLGVSSGLGAVSFLMKKGNEASIGKGKVMFATLTNPIR